MEEFVKKECGRVMKRLDYIYDVFGIGDVLEKETSPDKIVNVNSDHALEELLDRKVPGT